jgi:hypothetical protein
MNFSEAAELDKPTNLQNRIGAARPFDRLVGHVALLVLIKPVVTEVSAKHTAAIIC